jgi:hypothetical protein
MVRSDAPSSRRGLLYIAVAGTAWGTGGAVAAILFRSSGLDYGAVSFWRLASGAVWFALGWPFCWIRSGRHRDVRLRDRRMLFAPIRSLGGPFADCRKSCGQRRLAGLPGLVPSALAYGLFYVGLTSVSATTAAVVALTEPLLAALIGVALLDEQLSAVAVVGGLVLRKTVEAPGRCEQAGSLLGLGRGLAVLRRDRWSAGARSRPSRPGRPPGRARRSARSLSGRRAEAGPCRS